MMNDLWLLHRLPNLAENSDNSKVKDMPMDTPVRMTTRFGGEEEEEEEDSGVVSSGINQLRRALSMISLEGIRLHEYIHHSFQRA